MDTFWNELIAAVAGALLATGIAAWITIAAQRRTLRNDLSVRMGRAAYSDYRGAEAYRHWVEHERVPARRRREMRKALDDAHTEKRIEHDAILKTIDIYFGPRTDPSVKWHHVMDRLTAYYLLASDTPSRWVDEILQRITGPDHSGLPLHHLASLELLSAGMFADIEAAMRAVQVARWRGKRQ